MPTLVAGHPALELCNTRGGWGTDHPNDYLTDFTALAIWSREIGLLSADESRAVRRSAELAPRRATATLRRVLDLREQLYHTLTA